MNKIIVLTGLLTFMVFSCKDAIVPKPKGYQRLELPEHTYEKITSECGFSWDIPTYSVMLPDSHPSAEKCWFNIYYKPFNATLHISYKPVTNRRKLIELMEDSRTMTYKHTVKADEIYEIMIGNRYVQGMMYELSGSTATNFQFYVTDTTKHFLRGSLYFNTQTNIDSILPALEHLKKDVVYMLESLRWNN